jgi:hypothetical protein
VNARIGNFRSIFFSYTIRIPFCSVKDTEYKTTEEEERNGRR